MLRFAILGYLGIFLIAGTAAAQDRFEALQYGSVVDELGRAMPNVEVRGLWSPADGSPWGPSLVSARTDKDGKFVVPLPAGEVSAIAMVAANGQGLAGYRRRHVTRPNERTWGPAKIVLKPLREYHIRVRDVQGMPVQGVNVSALREFLGDFVKQTDQQGEATIIAPEEFDSDAIVAWDEDAGIDYILFDGHKPTREGRITKSHDKAIEMTLVPWSVQRVQVVDLDGEPVEGVSVTTESITIAERSSRLSPGPWRPSIPMRTDGQRSWFLKKFPCLLFY